MCVGLFAGFLRCKITSGVIKQYYSVKYKGTSSTLTFHPLDLFLSVSFVLCVLPPLLSSIKSAHRSQGRIILFNTAKKTHVTADALLINFNLELLV